MDTEQEQSTRNSRGVAAPLAAILAALYLPQSWYFLMDYSWDSYRLFWLRFLPGLPTFFPVAWFTMRHETLMLVCLWASTALIAVALFALSRRKRIQFWIALAVVCGWSIASALSAHAVFRA